MDEPGTATPSNVRESVRSLFTLAALLLASLWLSTPAVAWKVHGAQHLSSPVSVDQHHHHDASGSPVDDREVPSDKDGPGHNHMLSGAASLTATVDGRPDLLVPASATVAPVGGIVPTLHELRRPPPSEPPRFS